MPDLPEQLWSWRLWSISLDQTFRMHMCMHMHMHMCMCMHTCMCMSLPKGEQRTRVGAQGSDRGGRELERAHAGHQVAMWV